MSSFFERLLGRKEPSSADMARERLKLVLVTDRSDLAPEKLEQMQAEIIQVIRRYIQIDESQVQIKLEQRERTNYLVADIPLARDHTPYHAADLPLPPDVAVSPEPPAAETPEAETEPGSMAGTSADADSTEPVEPPIEDEDTRPSAPPAGE